MPEQLKLEEKEWIELVSEQDKTDKETLQGFFEKSTEDSSILDALKSYKSLKDFEDLQPEQITEKAKVLGLSDDNFVKTSKAYLRLKDKVSFVPNTIKQAFSKNRRCKHSKE